MLVLVLVVVVVVVNAENSGFVELSFQINQNRDKNDFHISFQSLECMYVGTVTHIARVWINRGRLPILLVVSVTGKMNICLSPFAPENLV